MKRIAAMVMNDKGELLPYVCDSTKEQCEEKAASLFSTWDKMKELGAKVVQVQVEVIEEVINSELEKEFIEAEKAYNEACRKRDEDMRVPRLAHQQIFEQVQEKHQVLQKYENLKRLGILTKKWI